MPTPPIALTEEEALVLAHIAFDNTLEFTISKVQSLLASKAQDVSLDQRPMVRSLVVSERRMSLALRGLYSKGMLYVPRVGTERVYSVSQDGKVRAASLKLGGGRGPKAAEAGESGGAVTEEARLAAALEGLRANSPGGMLGGQTVRELALALMGERANAVPPGQPYTVVEMTTLMHSKPQFMATVFQQMKLSGYVERVAPEGSRTKSSPQDLLFVTEWGAKVADKCVIRDEASEIISQTVVTTPTPTLKATAERVPTQRNLMERVLLHFRTELTLSELGKMMNTTYGGAGYTLSRMTTLVKQAKQRQSKDSVVGARDGASWQLTKLAADQLERKWENDPLTPEEEAEIFDRVGPELADHLHDAINAQHLNQDSLLAGSFADL